MTSRDKERAVIELIAETAANWYLAHREGELSPAERREFLRWLRASPVHVREYLAIARLGPELGAAAQHVGQPTHALLDAARAADTVVPIGSGARDMHRAAVQPHRRAATWLRRCAALAACVLVGIAALPWLLPQDGRTIATRRGEQRTQELADGTVVHLDSETELVERFGAAQRRVEIRRGQAMFEVAQDPARPFRVRVGDATIEDVGTVFDVSARAARTTVTVLEGRVAIWHGDGPPARRAPDASNAVAQPLADLKAGEQARIAPSGRVDRVVATDLRKATAWRRQEIVFDHDPIADVAAEFNRYNRLQVVVEDPNIAAIPISGTLRAYDVQAFVDFLNHLPNVRASVSGQRIRVVGFAPPRTHAL